jgi:hypothetical protein
MRENSSIPRRKTAVFHFRPFDSGEKGALGYGGFPKKTTIFAARAESSVI